MITASVLKGLNDLAFILLQFLIELINLIQAHKYIIYYKYIFTYTLKTTWHLDGPSYSYLPTRYEFSNKKSIAKKIYVIS